MPSAVWHTCAIECHGSSCNNGLLTVAVRVACRAAGNPTKNKLGLVQRIKNIQRNKNDTTELIDKCVKTVVECHNTPI